nr:MAG TPA: hypothetical protein [Bacteriophage sp.]
MRDLLSEFLLTLYKKVKSERFAALNATFNSEGKFNLPSLVL